MPTRQPQNIFNEIMKVAISSRRQLITLTVPVSSLTFADCGRERTKNGRNSRELKPLARSAALCPSPSRLARHRRVALRPKGETTAKTEEWKEKSHEKKKIVLRVYLLVCNVHLIMPPDFIISRLFLCAQFRFFFVSPPSRIYNNGGGADGTASGAAACGPSCCSAQIYMHKKI